MLNFVLIFVKLFKIERLGVMCVCTYVHVQKFQWYIYSCEWVPFATKHSVRKAVVLWFIVYQESVVFFSEASYHSISVLNSVSIRQMCYTHTHTNTQMRLQSDTFTYIYIVALFIIQWLLLLSVLVHRLKPLDIEFMKQLHELVNIVPVIAKADTLTPNEVHTLKRRVSNFMLLGVCLSALQYHYVMKLF